MGAITLSAVKVVDLVASALISAYSLVNIVNLAVGTGRAEIVNQVESGLANASSRNPILIFTADWSADSIAALT